MSTMRNITGISTLLALLLAGCQYDPYTEVYTTKRPSTNDLVGVYVANTNTLALIAREGHYTTVSPSITLESGGAIIITNIPDWWLTDFGEPHGGFDSGRGTWEIDKHQKWWALWVGFLDTTQFASRSNKAGGLSIAMMLIGEKPPYKIHLNVGDPDAGRGMQFERSPSESILPLLTDGTNAPATLPSEADDFTPMLGIFAAFMIMIMAVVFMLLLGIGLAVGIVVCALAGALTAFGILSSSAAVGFIRRSPASGFRALFLQLGAVAGIPCGIAGAWLVSSLTHSHWTIAARLLTGGAVGLVCGVLVAWLFNFVWGKIGAWIIARYDRRHPEEQRVEAAQR